MITNRPKSKDLFVLLDKDNVTPPPDKKRYFRAGEIHCRVSIYRDFWIVEAQDLESGSLFIPLLLEVKKIQAFTNEAGLLELRGDLEQ